MTSKEHAAYIADRAREEIFNKYMRGDERHGGRLWRKPCLAHAREEAQDQMVYLIALADQIGEAIALAEDITGYFIGDHPVKRMAQSIINTLTIGNPEGVQEEERDA